MIGVQLSMDAAPVVHECLRPAAHQCHARNGRATVPALTLTDALNEGCGILESVLLEERTER